VRIDQPFSRCSAATQPRRGPFVPPARYGSSASPTPWRTRKSLACGAGPRNERGANCGRRRRPHRRVYSGSPPSCSASCHPSNEAPPQPRERSGGMAGAQSGGKAPTRTTYRAPLAGRSRIGCVAVAAPDGQRLRPARVCPPPPVRESPPGRSARERRRPRARAGPRERVLREWSCRVRYPAWQGLNRWQPGSICRWDEAASARRSVHVSPSSWSVVPPRLCWDRVRPPPRRLARPARAASASFSDRPTPGRCPFWYSSVRRHDLPVSPDGPVGRGSRCAGRPGSAG
jgi:hypothetical protein